jgi:hypothetical protein
MGWVLSSEAVFARVVRTGRIAGTSSVLLVACGLMAAAPGFALGARPARRSAVVSGYVAPERCVTTRRVAAVNWNGRRVAVQRLRHGRFSLRLTPGRYTIEVLGDGPKARGRVMQRKQVTARADRTTPVHFAFDVT